MHELEKLTKRWSDAVRRVARAKVEISAALNEELEARRALQLEMTPGGELSHRPREVLDLLHQGKTNKEIAAALNIEVTTVKFHVGNILRKFSAADRRELLRSTPWVEAQR